MFERISKLFLIFLIAQVSSSPQWRQVPSTSEESTTQFRREASSGGRRLDDRAVTVGSVTFTNAYFTRTNFIGGAACKEAQAATYEVDYVSACTEYSSSKSPQLYVQLKFSVQNGCNQFIEQYFSTSDCTGQVFTTSPALSISLMTNITFDVCTTTSTTTGSGSYIDQCTSDASCAVKGGQYFLENLYNHSNQDCPAAGPHTSTYYRANYCLQTNSTHAMQWVRNESNYMVAQFYASSSCIDASSSTPVSKLGVCRTITATNQQAMYTYSSGSAFVAANIALSIAVMFIGCAVLV